MFWFLLEEFIIGLIMNGKFSVLMVVWYCVLLLWKWYGEVGSLSFLVVRWWMFLWFIVSYVVCVVGIMFKLFFFSFISVGVWIVLIFGIIRFGCFVLMIVCSVVLLSMLIMWLWWVICIVGVLVQ